MSLRINTPCDDEDEYYYDDDEDEYDYNGDEDEEDYDLEMGFDPYMGCYTEDC